MTTHATAFAGSLASIVRGGAKSGPRPWQTFSWGGHAGEGCGAGIDYVPTPTQDSSSYYFGTTDGRSYDFYAYIPENGLATAVMDFTLYVCGRAVNDRTVEEIGWSGWTTLYSLGGNAGCGVSITAWSGMVSSGAYLGLDAIRSNTP